MTHPETVTPARQAEDGPAGSAPHDSIPPRRRVWPVGIRALRHRNYRLFFTGQLISVVGTWMQSAAQAWLVYRLTGSALLLGLVGFADRAPVLVFGLAGGLVADRFDRRSVVLVTQMLLLVQAASLGLLVVSDRVEVWHIFLLATVQGLIGAFDLPARQSFISGMVEQDDLPNALALNSTLFNAARVVGPAVAGILIAAAGEGVCFLANAASYVAVIACLVMMRMPPPGARLPLGSTRAYLMEGLRYAGGSPPSRSLLVLLGVISICGMPYYALMPIFAGEILHGGARGFGILMGTSGAGACLAGLVLAHRQSVKGLGRVVAVSAALFGASLVAFSLSKSFLLSAGLLAVVGYAMITHSAATNLLLQSLTPDRLRGRVMSLYAIMLVGMAPFGSLLAGSIAHRAGAPIAVAIGGALCILAGAVFAVGIPGMRRFVRYPIPETPLGPPPPR